MANAAPEQVVDLAGQDRLEGLYLVVGEEEHRRDEVAAALRAACRRQDPAGLNLDAVTAGEVEVSTVAGLVRTLPMMAPRRLVIVRQLERWDAKKKPGKKAGGSRPAPLDELADLVAGLPASSVLVLLASKLDKRRRLVTQCQKHGVVVACEPLRRAELPAWVRRQASLRGARLAPGADELIAELSGPSLATVADAVERLALYSGDRPIDDDAISACLVKVRSASVWELVEAVGRRDLRAALTALADVYDPSDRGLPLLGLLAWSTRQLLRYGSARRRGLDPTAATSAAGAPPFKARDLERQARAVEAAQLERFLIELGSLDLALKGGSNLPSRAVLEGALVSWCQPGLGRTRP